MTEPEQLRAVMLAYDAIEHEWRRLLVRPDVPAGWLSEVRSRLCGPEFCGSGSEVVELWRLEMVLLIEDRLEQILPGYITSTDTPREVR